MRVYLGKTIVFVLNRNNFTIIESIDLIGEGGLGNLQIGSEEFPIVLEINSNQYEFCLSKQIDLAENANFILFLNRFRWKFNLGKNFNIEKYWKYADYHP